MEKVTGAELRIPFEITVSSPVGESERVKSELIKGQRDENNLFVDTTEASSIGELKAVRILLCDVMKPATSPVSKKPKESHLVEPITYPIDSKTVVLSKRKNGTSTFWLTFDVFPAVARWMSNPKKNHGLALEIVGVTNEGHTLPQETVVQRHNLRVKRDAADNYASNVFSSDGRIISSDSTSDGQSGVGSGQDKFTTESFPSAESTQDSGESLSLFNAQTPPSSLVVSSSSSPREVGVAAVDDFISSNNDR